MPVKSLRPTTSVQENLYQKSYGQISSAASSGRQRSDNSSSFPITSRTARHASDHFPQTSHNRARVALADIGNIDLRTALSNDIASCKITRRVVSDPTSRIAALSPFKTYKSSCEKPTPTFPLRGNVTAPALRICTGGSKLDSGAASEAVSQGTVDTVPETVCGDQHADIPDYSVCKKVHEEQPIEIVRDVQAVLTVYNSFSFLELKSFPSSLLVPRDLHLSIPAL